jgi:hypothetical protein
MWRTAFVSASHKIKQLMREPVAFFGLDHFDEIDECDERTTFGFVPKPPAQTTSFSSPAFAKMEDVPLRLEEPNYGLDNGLSLANHGKIFCLVRR